MPCMIFKKEKKKIIFLKFNFERRFLLGMKFVALVYETW